jgi:hypothetical protein
MSNTMEIPRERWSSFLATFNRVLGGRPVRVEVMGRTLGDQELAELQPFQGVDYDHKGSERDTLTLHVGETLEHRIARPTHLYLYQNDAGEMEWLAVEEAGEAQTLIHFEHIPELQAEYQGAP